MQSVQSEQREHIEIGVSVDGRILPWCLHKVGELRLHVHHPVWNRTNRSELAWQYCLYWKDGEGFLSHPLEALVPRVGYYTPSVISVKASVMNVAEAELNKDSWLEAFPVRQHVKIGAEYL